MSKRYQLFLMLCLCVCVSCSHIPSDAKIRKIFEEHHSEIIELKDMITSEKEILAIGTDNVDSFWLVRDRWTTHKRPYVLYKEDEMLHLVGLSQERYQRYLELLKAVNGYRVTRNTSNEKVSIHLFRVGNVSSGQMVNIVFLSDIPTLLVDDTEKSIGDNLEIWYSKLEGNWYIEHER